jgi:8-oxo-dGTP pyrophosphatase MutT (NUDIX family)
MKSIKVKSSGGIVYCMENGVAKYLLLRHVKTGSHWGFPKGRLEAGESVLDAAKREIFEETGMGNFSFEKNFCEDIRYSFVKDGSVRDKTVTYFLAMVKRKETKISEEHTDFFWGEYDEILEKLENKTDIDVFKKANSFININLSDCVLVSFPKCGRTWLAMILSRILQKKYGLLLQDIMSLEKITFPEKKLPGITMVHEDDPQLKKPNELSKDKRYILNKKIIFLIRDPRDVIVSWYFHQAFRRNRYDKNLSDFLKKSRGGFETIIEYYNIWLKYIKNPNFLLVKYEDLSKNPKKEIQKILTFLEIKGIRQGLIKKSIKESSFEKMKEMEKNNVFGVKRLMPKDVKDPRSFKVRSGKVGSYKKYLSKKEIEILNSKLFLLKK